ncbi:hypothetical protein LINGRAHAP2_LOCUS34361 [Linum grandiflorum]
MLGCLTDVRRVHEYVWGGGGADTLSHIYRELGKASRATGKNFCRCMTLLQSWI